MNTILRPRVFHKESRLDFKDRYPDYAEIEEHIRRARLERTVAIAQFIADAVDRSQRMMKRLSRALGGRGAPPAKARRQPVSG